MEYLGEILLAISIMTTLAAVGVATFLAFGLMAALGLLTELSFKRLFFLSFGAALLLPIVVGGVTIAAVQDEGVQNEIREEMRRALPPPDEMLEDMREAVPQSDGVEGEAPDGRITAEEFEQRLEELIPGADVQIDSDGFRITTSDGESQVQVDPTDDQ